MRMHALSPVERAGGEIKSLPVAFYKTELRMGSPGTLEHCVGQIRARNVKTVFLGDKRRYLRLHPGQGISILPGVNICRAYVGKYVPLG